MTIKGKAGDTFSVAAGVSARSRRPWATGDLSQTHLDLAIAYREMGLHPDKVLEAAEALRLSGLPRARTAVALELLLDRNGRAVGVDEALAIIRNSQFVN